MRINRTAKKIHAIAKEKGFWDKPRNFGELLMLTVSELGECLDADREGKYADTGGFNLSSADHKEAYEAHIKGTVEEELADTAIRLFDIAAGFGIDLEWHIKQKMKYNKTRERLHGKKY